LTSTGILVSRDNLAIRVIRAARNAPRVMVNLAQAPAITASRSSLMVDLAVLARRSATAARKVRRV